MSALPVTGVLDITGAESASPSVLDGVDDRIAVGTASIAVIGLGDRGLHLLLSAMEEGFPVIGIDADGRRIRALREGRAYLQEGGEAGRGSLNTTRFATSPVAALAADIVIVTGADVDQGTPEQLMGEVAEGLRRGQLVVVDSVMDGHVADRVRAALESSGLHAGADFGLAVAVGGAPGAAADTRSMSACDERAAHLAERVYRKLGVSVCAVAWDTATRSEQSRPCTPGEQRILEQLRERSIDVTVVIPALNEADGLRLILPTIPTFVNELIVVDGGSKDDTLRVIGRLYPSAVRIRQRGRGKGDAIKAGLAASTGDIVVTMDADGSMSPADIVPAVGALLDGCDFVKGSRALAGAGSDDFTPLHRLGNWALTAMSNVVFGAGYTDLTYGFNAYWRRVMLNADTLSDGFEFEIQAAIRASRSGLLTAEVPCFEAPRAGGASKLSPMRDGWAIARILAREARPRSVTGFRAVADFYLPPSDRGGNARPARAIGQGAGEHRLPL
ncbi:MAG: glycosyltransferase [Acidimicrobiia bacterium]